MNAEERQALREKHFSDFCDCHDEHAPFKCVGCSRLGATVVWPCEVIQVLDAIENHLISCDTESTEERKFSDLETEVGCDHYYGLAYDFPDGWELRHYLAKSPNEEHTSDLFTFCPKCGEKL